MFYLAHGVMFLGTPHRGSSIAELATTAQRAPKALWKHPNLAILEALQVDSKVLERVHKGFSETVYERPEIGLQSFHEEYRTKGVLVVPPFSSVIGFPTELSGSIPAKHSNMTKFCEPTDTGFVRITGTLRHWIAEIVTDVAGASCPQFASLSSH
ncbi:uncharacterized protein PV06_11820 [Exophiala oligosperma]|uniref:Uncharacterized protein n=1 Tax=Exophiala oligosperma TaxID=215243 RepID=A0A0D2CXQ0_9EURO|nr:uncharacterized protein PV06_11820 [Exophiala oligosperma]KIW35858.1 hypothetical protein PV06_11820 [Exophiala oligosperma]